MLVLSRRIGEQILIYPRDIPEDMTVKELFESGQVSIEILGMRCGQVRVGINAPKKLAILRDELT